ncbi:MAG: pimeloyl-ACP methyl ester carboxylesterase [Arenicella sp.]|jgi:pimeloyl-ACP methyl ester carboxylesterase
MTQTQNSTSKSTALNDLDGAVTNASKWLTEALSVEREEGWLDSNGTQIHYFRWGDPSKPGLLLLHGFLAHSRCFAFIAPFLANDYHIIAYDLSGMGDSGARDDYPDDIRVAEAVDVAQHTGLFDNAIKPTVIAHSYGGIVGTAAVNAHPEKFAGLVICDLMVIRPEILKKHADNFRRPGSQNPDKPNRIYADYQSAKQRFVLAPPQEVEQPELLEFMAYHSLKQVEGGWSWKFSPSVYPRVDGVEKRWTGVGQRIVGTPGRVAIIYGRESKLFTADSANYIRELGGNSIPIIDIPYARHHLMLDQPIAFTTALKSVLALWQ